MNEQNAYLNSFGAIPNGTVYYDPAKPAEVNKKTLEMIWNHLQDKNPVYANQKSLVKKALESGAGASSVSIGLAPVYVDPTIVDTSRKFTPFRNLLKRVTNMGKVADYNLLTAKGGAVTYAETDAATETTDTYTNVHTDIKLLRAVGKVTGFAQAAIAPYNLVGTQIGGSGVGTDSSIATSFAPNAVQLEVFSKMRSLAELEEALLFNGNETTSTYGGANGTEFNGLVKIMGTTNATDGGGTTALTEAMLNKAIKDAYDDSGRPSIAFCDSSTYQDIMALISPKIRITDISLTTEYGITGIKWLGMTGSVTIYPSQFLTSVSGSKSIYFVDMNYWELRVLQDATYEELARDGDYIKFQIKEYLTLICRAPKFNSSIINLL